MTVSINYHPPTGNWSAFMTGAEPATVLLFVITVVVVLGIFTLLMATAEKLLEKYNV